MVAAPRAPTGISTSSTNNEHALVHAHPRIDCARGALAAGDGVMDEVVGVAESGNAVSEVDGVSGRNVNFAVDILLLWQVDVLSLVAPTKTMSTTLPFIAVETGAA